MCLLEMTVIRPREHGMRITKRSVDTQKTPNKTTYIWDEDLSGFGVKLLPSGRKTYLVQYRIGGRTGRTRRVSLGVHGNVTAEIARTEAKKLLGQVAIGIDPLAKRDEMKEAQTVVEILQIFMTNHVCVKLALNTQVNYESIIRLHIPAHFKKMFIQDVTRQDVARLHHDMRESKSMANKTLAVLSKFLIGVKNLATVLITRIPVGMLRNSKKRQDSGTSHQKNKSGLAKRSIRPKEKG